jgi:hypothetical protein
VCVCVCVVCVCVYVCVLLLDIFQDDLRSSPHQVDHGGVKKIPPRKAVLTNPTRQKNLSGDSMQNWQVQPGTVWTRGPSGEKLAGAAFTTSEPQRVCVVGHHLHSHVGV